MTIKEIVESIKDLFSGFLDGIEVVLLKEDYKVTDEIFELLSDLEEYYEV